jgi:hypothetical protein
MPADVDAFEIDPRGTITAAVKFSKEPILTPPSTLAHPSSDYTFPRGNLQNAKSGRRPVTLHVWRDMNHGTTSTADPTEHQIVDMRRRYMSEEGKIFYDYSERNRMRRPVRVEMSDAKGK